jgi:hypothetical protein
MVGELGMLERDVSVLGSEARSFRLEVQVIHYTKLEERRPDLVVANAGFAKLFTVAM